MTDAGIDKLKPQDENSTEADIEPGIDYVVKSEGGKGWVPLPDSPGAQHFRY